MTTHLYILVDGEPVGVENVLEWMRWRQEHLDDCRVALTKLDGVEISTVFLAVDYGLWSEEMPPILFETMIFGGDNDRACRRYSTLEEAMKGHEEMVERALEVD